MTETNGGTIPKQSVIDYMVNGGLIAILRLNTSRWAHRT